mgnify:FL=1
MKIQKILAVLLSLAMMLSLAACSSTPAASEAPAATDAPAAEETAAPEESAEAETPAANGEVSMKFTWWGSDVRHEATEKATKLYCEQNNVNIVTEYSAWEGYWEKMAVLAASNSMPDIFQMDAAYINTYIEQNQLADLTDILDLTGVMDASLIENYKHDGKLYGAPVGANGTGIVYIKSDLAKYGIEEPKEGWTWDDMIAWAKDAATKLPDGVYPLVDGRAGNPYESMQNYIQTKYGIKILDGNTFNFTQDMFKEYYNLYADLRDGNAIPTAEESLSFVELDPLNDSFTSRKVLLRQINVGNVAGLADMVPDEELGVVNFPQGEVGGGWAQSTMFYCVGANSAYVNEACDFIEWILSDVEAGKILSTVRGLPVSDAVYEVIEPDLTKSQQYGMEMYKAINNDQVKGLPYWNDVPSAYSSWVSEFKATSESVMLGEMSIDEAAQYLDTIGQQVAATLN